MGVPQNAGRCVWNAAKPGQLGVPQNAGFHPQAMRQNPAKWGSTETALTDAVSDSYSQNAENEKS